VYYCTSFGSKAIKKETLVLHYVLKKC